MGGRLEPLFTYEDYRKLLGILLLSENVDRELVDNLNIKLLDYFEALRVIENK